MLSDETGRIIPLRRERFCRGEIYPDGSMPRVEPEYKPWMVIERLYFNQPPANWLHAKHGADEVRKIDVGEI